MIANRNGRVPRVDQDRKAPVRLSEFGKSCIHECTIVLINASICRQSSSST
jgi:hypothetical protein